ncbi:LytR/AlgR family response regulator transcription factor [Dyadobacter psychrotolerans]|uniref:Response regulator transcription factor n=1 Tax=Dyadobacter psychrotolerans TaxID=2541721 RepID=A0A4R5DDF7_9BACT|nr:LytTR family DNA-binding domain-containing protein [Dyadobacter psychrotolerans]TDE10020.1 response regulator transcription factor [Dyadobacter psychrotolerans]
MTLNAIAIDDEPKALEVVKMHAAKVPYLTLKACFTNAFEAIPYLQTNQIDLIFLDIKMPDISGIDFINCLQKVPMVIFTTAYSEYAVQGFELDALDYLLKPFSLTRFTKSCNKALDLHLLRKPVNQNFIFVKTGYEEEKVLLDDLLYVEAEGNYISFILKNKKLLSRQSMTEVTSQLPETRFIRIHRSYLIAIDKIEKISRQELMIAGQALPIGASYEEKINEIRERIKERK